MLKHPGTTNEWKALLFFACVASVSGARSTAAAAEIPIFPREAQIKLAAGCDIESIEARYGVVVLDSLPPSFLVRLPADADETAYVEALRADAEIVAAECSWADETPEGTRQMVVTAVGSTIEEYLDQCVLDRIRAGVIQERTTGAGVRVAIIDSGIFSEHEALAGAVASGGWDFVDGDDDPSDGANGVDDDADGLIDEGAGHGTMVAGIVHLLAPDAELLPIRVLDDEGRGRVFAVAKGIDYALAAGADVINLSLGLLQHTFVIQDQILACAERGVPVIAAAGNLSLESPPYYPALDPQVVSIAAVDSMDIKADFSNWHRSVDLSAPGVGILAPYHDGGFAIGAGTSFSAPFVAAQCAWVLSLLPGLSAAETYGILRSGVVDIYGIPENEPYLDELGSGRVDGLATWIAIQQASGVLEPDGVRRGAAIRVWPSPAGRGWATRIEIADPRGASLGIDVLDATGRIVRRIAPGTMEWNGRDDAGRLVSSGMYLLRLRGTRTAVHLLRID